MGYVAAATRLQYVLSRMQNILKIDQTSENISSFAAQHEKNAKAGVNARSHYEMTYTAAN
ncbi:MAG TPA: hypothetical protein VJ654_01355 [Noviherbaspirillum sp.]|nr:hypothetical protein [Noviherbaspirillum sp.]